MWRLLIVYLLLREAKGQYEPPNATFEVTSPRGFKVWIPYEDGIEIFAFHGKVNKEIHNREAGTFSVDITKPMDGKLTYWERTTKLKPGDVIYYWIYVQFLGRGYPVDDQQYVVTDVGVPATTTTTTTTARPTKTTTTRTTTERAECKTTSTTINGNRRTCKDRVIFEENFPGNKLNEKKWKTEFRMAPPPDFEFVVYADHEDVLITKRNLLHIQPALLETKFGKDIVRSAEGLDLRDKCTGDQTSFECYRKPKAWLIIPPVMSAQISTKEHFTFRYGVVEIRAKLPKGDWLYPELYLRPRYDEYGPHYESGQIVIALAPGNADTNGVLSGGCILGSSQAGRTHSMGKMTSTVNWSDDYHVFQVKWKPDAIIVSVDNQTYVNIEPPFSGFSSLKEKLEQPAAANWRAGSRLAPFDKEMYLTIGVGAGGYAFADVDYPSKPWINGDPKDQLNFYKEQDVWSATWGEESQLIVDYIKVTAL